MFLYIIKYIEHSTCLKDIIIWEFLNDKTMKKQLFLLALLVGSAGLQAQTADHKVAVGLTIGKQEYSGDLGNAMFNFKKPMYVFGGISVAGYLNPSFDLGIQGTYGEYGYNNGEPVATNRNFWGKKYQGTLFLHYKFNNGYLLKEESMLSPFIEVGGGIAQYEDALAGRIEDKGIDALIPVGAGLKFQFSPYVALQYKFVYNFTNHDKRDFVINNGNDKFAEHALSVIFSLDCGCKKDADKDGVIDDFDACPNTPATIQVDEKGCPLDSDHDGVADYLDKCPDTPAGAKVDASGCPTDSDGDGVADYLDKCPNTPAGAKVDANGCSLDSDGDGVPDNMDKCADTPKGTKVNADGCPLDSDGDGVVDSADKCPGTPAGVKVDANGCPLDTDGDGIADYQDECPTTPGIVANKGCPAITAEVKKIFAQALQGVQFESGKNVIKKSSYDILDKVVKVMKENPEYKLEINGHTDNSGDAAKNLDLSQKRAEAVKAYLTKAGIDKSRLTAKGHGEEVPVADNATAAGKAKNRRVEFKVNF